MELGKRRKRKKLHKRQARWWCMITPNLIHPLQIHTTCNCWANERPGNLARAIPALQLENASRKKPWFVEPILQATLKKVVAEITCRLCCNHSIFWFEANLFVSHLRIVQGDYRNDWFFLKCYGTIMGVNHRHIIIVIIYSYYMPME